jgi:N-acetylmuramoyl-L-alanine amidase
MTSLAPEDRVAIQRNNWRVKRVQLILDEAKHRKEVGDLLEDILQDNYEVLDTSTPTHVDGDALPNPVAAKPPETREAETATPNRGSVGLFVGHNARTGATAIDGLDEWTTRNTVALKAFELLRERGFTPHVIYRDGRLGYTSAMKEHGRTAARLGLDVSLELHFNAYDGSAHGAELIVASTTTRDTLGNAFVDATTEYYPDRVLRGGGVKLLKGGRGYGFNRHQPCPSGVYEPCFGDSTEWYDYDDEVDKEAAYIVRIIENYFQCLG